MCLKAIWSLNATSPRMGSSSVVFLSTETDKVEATEKVYRPFIHSRVSLVPQVEKYLPVIQETQVQSLGCEDALEKGIATHSSILAWRNPWTEEPGGLQTMDSQRVRHD